MSRFWIALGVPVCLLMLLPAGAQIVAKESVADSAITVERKPGQEDGVAQMVVKGKVRKISQHAVAAFPVRDGEGALVIVLRSANGSAAGGGTAKQYELRYYDLDSVRRRELGVIPMSGGTVVETAAKRGGWAFALSGTDLKSGQPVVLIGDEQAIPGRLSGVSALSFVHDDRHHDDGHEEVVRYVVGGETREAELGVLLGTGKDGIYSPIGTASVVAGGVDAPKLLQVFPNGTAMAMSADGVVHKASWQTDGTVLELQPAGPQGDAAKAGKGMAAYSVAWVQLETVKGVPAAKRFVVRLTAELSSRKTHKGDVVKAVSITPVVVGTEILIPAGSEFEGKVVQANTTGWGFQHETASLTIEWTKATIAGGRELAIDMRVFQVENAQENVNDKGKIQGIRSTGTAGNSAQNGVLTFAGIDPIAYVFASAAGSGVLGFAEPEILYHAGTELVLENMRPLLTAQAYPAQVLPVAVTTAEQATLQTFVKTLPYRTKTKGSNKVSDLTNLVFVGSASGLERAFKAAGWLPTDDLTAGSTFRTLKTLSGNQTYTQAPMSILVLDEREPIFALSKTTNTFSSRHHIRVFPTNETRDGHMVLTASSTQDIGIAFSPKQKTFIHVIDQHIDNERSKVVNDLVFTGCVESLDMVERPWVPKDAYNSTGDRLLTDDEAAVLRISDCPNPRATSTAIAALAPRGKRIVRDTALSIRNGLYRGNLVYQGISGAIAARRYFRSSSELTPSAGAWRLTDASGSTYKGYGQGSKLEESEYNNPKGLQRRDPNDFNSQPSPADVAAIKRAKEDHKWDPPKYEFALHGGYVHMRSSYLSAVGVLEESSNPNADAHFIFLVDNVGDGWAAGGSVTVNSWKHFSNEFSYFRQQVKYELGAIDAVLPANQETFLNDSDIVPDRIGLVTRQFEYNLLIHATKPSSRWRPYAAVGPVLQLVALNGNPLKKPAGVYTLGLKNIGLIKAAFDFGNTPPLDGGGIFHVGLQYGGGIKYRVTPRVTMRADWRETWAKNPDIIADSYQDYDPIALDETYKTTVIRVAPEKAFIKERFTLGVAFTF